MKGSFRYPRDFREVEEVEAGEHGYLWLKRDAWTEPVEIAAGSFVLQSPGSSQTHEGMNANDGESEPQQGDSTSS